MLLFLYHAARPCAKSNYRLHDIRGSEGREKRYSFARLWTLRRCTRHPRHYHYPRLAA
jgi:hypothetical protein